MQLLTAEIKTALTKAVSQGERPPEQTPIILKLFTPWAGATWFVTEGELLEHGDWRLFGFADLGDRQCAELGYVMLSDIASLVGPGGLRVERDLHYPTTTLADVLREYDRL